MGARYKNLIFTNHALERMRQRGLSRGDVWAAWKNPDQSRYARSKGNWVYIKRHGSVTTEVVAKKNEKGQWLVISAWSKPVYGKSRSLNIFHLPNLAIQIGLLAFLFALYILFIWRLVVQNSCLNAFRTKVYEFSDCQLSTISNTFLGLGLAGFVILGTFFYFLTNKFYRLILASIILITILVGSYYMFIKINGPQLFTAQIYLDTVK